MSRIIKQGSALSVEGVVQIPDTSPAPFLEDGPGEEEAVDPVVEAQLEKAREEADRLFEQRKREAESFRDQLMDKTRADIANLQEEARRQGYAEGAAQKVDEIDAMLEHTGDLLEQLLDEHKGYLKRYEQQLGDFAIEIASKILAKKIEVDDYALQELVREAMTPFKEAEWITVELCDEMPELIERLEAEFARGNAGQRIEFLARDLPADTVRLSTPENVVDASLSTQIRNLKALFRELGPE